MIVGLEGGNLYILTQSLNITTQTKSMNLNESKSKKDSNSRKIKLPYTPISITILDKKKVLLISTEDNIFYLLSLRDFQPIMLVGTLQEPFMKASFYAKETHKKVPAIIGETAKVIAFSYPNGQIDVWKNL